MHSSDTLKTAERILYPREAYTGSRCGRGCGATLANARAFAQLRTLSGSNPCTGNKKATGLSQSLTFEWVGRQGFEPWTLGLRVPCSTN